MILRSNAGAARGCAWLVGLVSSCGGAASTAAVVDFEQFDQPPYSLGPESFYNGSDGAGGFTIEGATFNNTFADFGDGFTAWSGWSVSNVTDNTTPGFDNQYSAFPGGGASGSEFYGIAFAFEPGEATIQIPPEQQFESLEVTNTTFTALSMLNGDGFAKQFGGETGDDPDFFKLLIEGFNTGGDSVGLIEFFLADYRFENNALDFIVDEWTSVDLTPLAGATELSLYFESSDVGKFGINTPTYAAFDNIVVTPEPHLALVTLLLAAGMLRRKRRSVLSGEIVVIANSQLPYGRGSVPTATATTQRQQAAMSRISIIALLSCGMAMPALAQSAFATRIIEYTPAPGQFVNHPSFNDPARALGTPVGGGASAPNNTSQVSLGGFGGTLVLGFDQTIMDDPANPFGLDAILYGNAFWVSGDPNRRWAECGVIEISRDINSNSLADDPWYVVPGSHLPDPLTVLESQTWDDDFGDATHPPANPAWVPPGESGTWITEGFRLPPSVFEVAIIENPDGPNAVTEGIVGYADYSPTQVLPDGSAPAQFYTRPDNPFAAGLTEGSGGGDGIDIAWAIDPESLAPANLDGFDFIRISTAVNLIAGALGEVSTEIDAVADVAEGMLGDADGNGIIDEADFLIMQGCLDGPLRSTPTAPCRVVDMDQDGNADLRDYALWMPLH